MLSSNPSPPFQSSSPLLSSPLFIPQASSSLEHQVSTELGRSSPTDKAILCYICAGDMGPACVCCLVGGLVFGNFL